MEGWTPKKQRFTCKYRILFEIYFFSSDVFYGYFNDDDDDDDDDDVKYPKIYSNGILLLFYLWS